MCCFAGRVKRMEQAKKIRDMKKRESSGIPPAQSVQTVQTIPRIDTTSTTSRTRTVSRVNPAYVPDEPRQVYDDRLAKGMENAKIMSQVLSSAHFSEISSSSTRSMPKVVSTKFHNILLEIPGH